jgi:hypothetical protein
MKNKDYNANIDILLRKALSQSEKPDTELLEKVKNYELIKEEKHIMKNTILKSSFRRITAAVVALFTLTTVIVVAAWNLNILKPSEVADMFGEDVLSGAFDSEDAVNINSSVTSGNYTFTLLSVLSGKELRDKSYYNSETQDDRTYAVVAIQNADGTPMSFDYIYGEPGVSFFASPLVKGLKPWLVNALTLHGGYSETIADGVLYRILECDTVAMFADRGLYFAISTSIFFNKDAFIYDEQTGEITANPDFDGASVIFNLPLDKSLADPEKAEEYLNGIGYYDAISDESDAELPVGEYEPVYLEDAMRHLEGDTSSLPIIAWEESVPSSEDMTVVTSED